MENNTIRIFIGSSANGEDTDMERIYLHTLITNRAVGFQVDGLHLEVNWMRQTHDMSSPWAGWETQLWPTPFSGFRWGIPAVCGFKGRAIYTDVDMINLRDIAALWNTPMDGKPFMARTGHRFGGHEFCVMMIDCSAAEYILPPFERLRAIPEMHNRMIGMLSGDSSVVQTMDARWNVLDGEGASGDLATEEMYQLHYTNMATQPWKPLWYRGSPGQHRRPDLVDFWYLHDKLAKESEAAGVFQGPQCGREYEPYGAYDFIGQ